MAKKKKRKRRENKRYEKYKVEGGKIIRPRYCPRCGAGIILARVKNRIHCGKCHYTEFLSAAEATQSKEEVKEAKEIKEKPKGKQFKKG